MTSTVTTAVIAANSANSGLISAVGAIIIVSLILLLMSKEYLAQFLEPAPLNKDKEENPIGFLIKLPNLAIPPFLFVFCYIIVYHALALMK